MIKYNFIFNSPTFLEVKIHGVDIWNNHIQLFGQINIVVTETKTQNRYTLYQKVLRSLKVLLVRVLIFSVSSICMSDLIIY